MNREIEQKLAASRGWLTVVGTDEAGKGPLAGPVYAAAVLLGDAEIVGLNDSKKLSEKRRDALFDEIIAKAAGYAIFSASAADVDAYGIDTCSYGCMSRAVDELKQRFVIDGVLVDGNRIGSFSIPAMCVVKGDAKCPSIAAASILAKVSRDRYMQKVHEQYPQFGFDRHKGYGTKLHREMIKQHGVCPEHRGSYLHFDRPLPLAKSRGNIGEDIALEHLQSKGYTLVERNYTERAGELDLIVKNDNVLVFAEVKLRNSADYGTPGEFVNRTKQKKIIKTATLWLSKHRNRLQPRFDIIEVYMPLNSNDPQQIVHIENAFIKEVP